MVSSKSQTHEAAVSKTEGKEPKVIAKERRETGKSYGYEGSSVEVIEGDTKLEEQKEKVVEAFDDFMDILVDRAGGGTAADTGGEGPGTGTGAAGAGTGAGYGSGAGTGTTAATTGGGAASSGRPSSGSGPATGGTGGERASEAAQAEAYARSQFVQQEAYRVDKARESAQRSHSESSATSPMNGHAPVAILVAGDREKHTSDSNRAPITQDREFMPAYGSEGRGTAPTIEKIVVPPSQRPETVPVAGNIVAGPPIDAYWGSFGSAIERAAARAKVSYTQLESIIGGDDRVRVTNNQFYPWRCIASLLITAHSGAMYIGTGWLVSPRVLLTAGHCVYMSDQGGWVTQIEVIPGRDAGNRPFNSAVATDFRSVTGWTQDHNSDYDYGAILLPADQRYGDQLGWFGYASRADDYLRGITLNLAGYPGDGGPAGIDGTQWYHSRGVRDVFEKQITYEIDTYGGQSGAPVWEMTAEGNRYGVAVHTWGTTVNNGGTRITSDVFDNIVLWAGQAP